MPLSGVVQLPTKQVKKNSSPLNQWGEEETLSGNMAPGPSMGWKRRHFCRNIYSVECTLCIKTMKNSQPFPLNGTFGNIPQIVRSIHRDYPKVKGASKSAFTSFTCNSRRETRPGFSCCPARSLSYTGFTARMNALTNFPSTSALSSSDNEAIEAPAPLSATS